MVYRLKKGLIRINILFAMRKLNKPVKADELAKAISEIIDFPVSHRRLGNMLETYIDREIIIRYKKKIRIGNKNIEESGYTYELNKGLMDE